MISASWPWSMKYSPIAQPEYGARYCIEAGSEADAATMIVCFIASCSSSLRTTLAIELCFWPIATYTHLMPLFF